MKPSISTPLIVTNLILTYVGTAALGCPPGVARRFLGTTQLMPKNSILSLFAVLVLTSCSPRDFLTHRLATDLISASDAFRTPQQFALQTGIVSNKNYVSPEYLILQQHGWISADLHSLRPRHGTAPLLGRPADPRRRRNRSSPGSRRRNRQD